MKKHDKTSPNRHGMDYTQMERGSYDESKNYGNTKSGYSRSGENMEYSGKGKSNMNYGSKHSNSEYSGGGRKKGGGMSGSNKPLSGSFYSDNAGMGKTGSAGADRMSGKGGHGGDVSQYGYKEHVYGHQDVRGKLGYNAKISGIDSAGDGTKNRDGDQFY